MTIQMGRITLALCMFSLCPVSSFGEQSEFEKAYQTYREAKYPEAFQQFTVLAKRGDDQQLFQRTPEFLLGECYHLGRGTKIDLATAVKWYEQAADKGKSPGAALRIAELLNSGGPGLKEDAAKANEWRTRAKQIATGYYDKNREEFSFSNIAGLAHSLEQQTEKARKDTPQPPLPPALRVIHACDVFIARDPEHALVFYLRGKACGRWLSQKQFATADLKESIRLLAKQQAGARFKPLIMQELSFAKTIKEAGGSTPVEKATPVEVAGTTPKEGRPGKKAPNPFDPPFANSDQPDKLEIYQSDLKKTRTKSTDLGFAGKYDETIALWRALADQYPEVDVPHYEWLKRVVRHKPAFPLTDHRQEVLSLLKLIPIKPGSAYSRAEIVTEYLQRLLAAGKPLEAKQELEEFWRLGIPITSDLSVIAFEVGEFDMAFSRYQLSKELENELRAGFAEKMDSRLRTAPQFWTSPQLVGSTWKFYLEEINLFATLYPDKRMRRQTMILHFRDDHVLDESWGMGLSNYRWEIAGDGQIKFAHFEEQNHEGTFVGPDHMVGYLIRKNMKGRRYNEFKWVAYRSDEAALRKEAELKPITGTARQFLNTRWKFQDGSSITYVTFLEYGRLRSETVSKKQTSSVFSTDKEEVLRNAWSSPGEGQVKFSQVPLTLSKGTLQSDGTLSGTSNTFTPPGELPEKVAKSLHDVKWTARRVPLVKPNSQQRPADTPQETSLPTSARARFGLARIYLKAGQLDESKRLLQMAVNQKYEPARGLLQQLEKGGTRAVPESVKKTPDMKSRLELSAEKGIPQAQYALGQKYLKEGKKAEATKWLKKSAAQGFKPAQSALRELESDRDR